MLSDKLGTSNGKGLYANNECQKVTDERCFDSQPSSRNYLTYGHSDVTTSRVVHLTVGVMVFLCFGAEDLSEPSLL